MIYFIRHGQTAMNRRMALQGRSDLPLNEEGKRQASRARDWFSAAGIRFDRVYSSPLSRAVETARIVAGESAALRTDERLLEMDYGPYEGATLEKPAPELLYFFRDFVNHPAPEGMEPLASVVERVGAFLRGLDVSPEETILVSTHAIAMKGALEYLTPDSNGAWWSRPLGNCAVFRTERRETGFSVPEEVVYELG